MNMKSRKLYRMKLKTAPLLFLLALAACSPTKYVAASSDTSTGYYDVPVDATSYLVSFHGNSNTGISMVTRYSLFRAAELTKVRGYDYFRVEDTQNSEHVQTSQSYTRDKSITTTPVSTDHHDDHGDHGSNNNGTVTDVKTTSTVNTDTQTDYTVVRTVRLFKGTPPQNDPDCYVASDMLQTMAPYVQR